MSDSHSEASEQGAQVRISLRLAASVQDRSLEVPKEPIAVPADIGRKGLSAVLNHLLGRSVSKDGGGSSESDSDDEDDDEEHNQKLPPPISFEFILAGSNKNRLLRKDVESEARQYGISLEEAIQITYFPAANPPDLSDDQEELPDWVSCLSATNLKSKNNHQSSALLCSGCYDGTIHLYDISTTTGQLKKLHSTSVATGPIKCLKTAEINGQFWIASASLDHSLHLHTYNSSNDGMLHAHGQCIQQGMSCAMSSLDFAFSSSNSTRLLASGDDNGSICIWDVLHEDETLEEESTKKQKISGGRGSNKISSKGKDFRPKLSMESAHSQLVSGLSWGNHHGHYHHSATESNSNDLHHLISGSWDHSVKLWDVEKQDCLLTLNGSRVVSCLDTSYHSQGVVATGHPDCTIRLWDVRTNNNQNNTSQQSAVISDTTFRPSHKAWVSSVQWSMFNPYHLASTSYDGTVKLWDIRSSNPLYTVRACSKDEKALCLVWKPSSTSSTDGGGEITQQQIYSGGTDCNIKHIRL